MQKIIGYVVQSLGIIFLVLGIVSAVITLLPQGGRGVGGSGLTDLIKALTAFVEALTVAPPWIALSVLGIVLILLGSVLVRRAPR